MGDSVVHEDTRGYFMETYNEKDMMEVDIGIHFAHGFLVSIDEKEFYYKVNDL